MLTRIIVSTVASLFVASFAFSQMKFSRPRSSSQSPTPTPTPSATPQQRMVPTSGRVRANPSPTPLPTPAGPQKMVPASAKIPAKQSPAPAQRTMPQPPQPKAMPMPATPSTQSKATPPPRTVAASIQPKALPTPAPTVAKPTPTPVPPPDVRAYLDRQIASSKDKKFHMTVNGKDLALTPFHVWMQKSTGPNSTSTSISMRSDEGRVYDIDFVTTGAQVTAISINRINGETLR